MNSPWTPASLLVALSTVLGAALTAAGPPGDGLEPRGKIHIPIGVADSLDSLKTFVEAEGPFSPGFATYGVYFWIHDREAKALHAATREGTACEHGLGDPAHPEETGGLLIPWISWMAGDTAVRIEVCSVERASPAGAVIVTAARVHLENRGAREARLQLYAALRPLGPAGGPVRSIAVCAEGDGLLVDGHTALISTQRPEAAGVLAADGIGALALQGAMPAERTAVSPAGDGSGALRIETSLSPGAIRIFGFIAPVRSGRRAMAHRWDGKSPWAQLDESPQDPPEGGILQGDPGAGWFRGLGIDGLFEGARASCQDLACRVALRLPDPRWAACFRAITGHVAMAMNGGAPDVSAINYNVYNRDGVYVASILQKAGRSDLAARAIDHFLAHPFSGRSYPEADNPGQILWILGQHWLFTRDRAWLGRVMPAARKLAAMIGSLRTTPGPHWVAMDSLEIGEAIPADLRRELKPGACDGFHPEYTEAFDIAGLRSAALLAETLGDGAGTARWSALAGDLFRRYDERFGGDLRREYGSYSVLWPCRLYPLGEGRAFEQFRRIGAQKPSGWRYFPLATAHQGLLAGSREAASTTLAWHLDHAQMRGWYAFDEGGDSGSGGWQHARTTWKSAVAMPHGWALAEVQLLLRDSLAFEDGGRLVLLAGVAEEWFRAPAGMAVEGLPTHFGPLSFAWRAGPGGQLLTLGGGAAPPGGFVLRLPVPEAAVVAADGKSVRRTRPGDFEIPLGTKEVRIKSP